MKKKTVGIIAIVAITAFIGWNSNQAKNNLKLSELTLNNVEALAACEVTAGGSCYWTSGYGRCCHGTGLGCSPCD